MRIVIDARLYGTKHTGNGRYTMNLVENLVEIDKQSLASKTGKKNKYFILLRKEDYDELKFPANWTKVLADFRHYTFSEQFRLPFILYKLKPDIVHFPHFNVPILYIGKYIVTIHDLIMHKSRGGEATTRPFPIYQIWRLGYYISFAMAVYGSKKIIVPTNTVKKDLMGYYKISDLKVVVTYEGIDERGQQIDFNSKGLGKYFSYVGNAYPHKNLERLINALAVFNKGRKEKVNLAISSARNVFTQRLLDIAKKYDIEKNVKLLGYVPDNQLLSFYNKSIAFFYPTLIEGFGLPGLEAMRAGTLVYSSDIPVLKEIYDGSVSYFDPFEVGSMVDSMERALKINSKERESIIKRAKEYISKYSWKKMARETLEVYNSTNGI